MSLISVIIPVYNVEKYLSQCIDSVITQNFSDIEIILVNDGSTDNSLNICKKYESMDSRVRVINKKNGGLSDARNFGIKAATGEYILFLDSDDYWNENCLDEISKFAKDDTDVTFLTTTKYYDKLNKIDENYESYEVSRIRNKSKKEIIEYLAELDKFPVSACTKLINRNFILKNKLFFKRNLLSEDIDWFTNVLLSANKFDVCNKEFYIYRQQRENSITSSIKKKNIEDMFYIIKKWTGKCEKKEIDSVLIKSLMSLYSYEYSILMGNLYLLNYAERNLIENEIKEKRYILNYANSKRTKLVKYLVALIGFKNTCKVLSIYIRSKK